MTDDSGGRTEVIRTARDLDGATTGIALDGDALVRDLGQPFAIERVSIKPYCAAKQVTSSIAVSPRMR